MSFQIKVYPRILTYLHNKIKNISQYKEHVHKGVKVASENFAKWFRATYLSGNPIKERTGRLKRSVKPVTRIKGNSIVGGISFGGPHIPYALVHINDEVGMPTVITPKKRRFLAIPIGLNTNKALYKSPLDMSYSVLRFPFAGVYNNRVFEPYFLYKQRVTLYSKVGMNKVMDIYKPIFMNDVLTITKDLIRKKTK